MKDECDMVLIGYLAFLDPPKESTADAIRALKRHGVTTKILTGDNDKVTRTICKQVGLKVRNMLLGSDLEAMSDDQLARAAQSTDVFAKLTPDQKARVVSVLRESGHTVGFMAVSYTHLQRRKVFPSQAKNNGPPPHLRDTIICSTKNTHISACLLYTSRCV